MTGVEPRISGVGSDCCTNSAKTTAQGKNLTVKTIRKVMKFTLLPLMNWAFSG